MLLLNYNPSKDKLKKIGCVKSSKSVGKIISSKKNNLSKMNEKLSLLNSDIEDLYKKYAEKKKIRRKKEKSEQNLVSRINFLIDEERKIRTQIENNPIQKKNNNKSKSLKIFNYPDTITNIGTIGYKTIESSDDTNRNGKYISKNLSKKKEKIFGQKNNNNINTLSSGYSAQNISMENISNHDNNNINRSNVTNNVCIIINNTDQNTSIKNSLHENNNNYFQEEISFSKLDKENNINNNSLNISDRNNSIGEKEKRKINSEIQNIKMKLASKIENNEIISDRNDDLNNLENSEDNTNTPSFNKNIMI